MNGKDRRMRRLFIGPEKRCLLVPLDHGPWLGPIAGINRPRDIAEKVVKGGANALLVTPGFFKEAEPVIKPETGVILRVSLSAGLSAEAVQETPAFTASMAARLDADAVAISIFFGRGGEVAMMNYLGQMIEECDEYGIPVLAEMMPPQDKYYSTEAIAHASRIGLEMGADIIKTNYSGKFDEFKQFLADFSLPVIIAGGPSKAEDDTLLTVKEIIRAGAAGVAFGRRVWQAADPETMVRDMRKVIFS
jgi:fructose-bisphosphate aldolase / 2-amino-3,7-dideoxy-D-threo-hept-6-ulosonate synthase